MAHEAVGADRARTMLGLADRAQIFDLFEAVMAGRLARVWVAGRHARPRRRPLVVLQDLLALTHWVTSSKPRPAPDRAGHFELERTRGAAFAEALSVAVLGRTWQMLLKGVGEVQCPQPMAACEMVLIAGPFGRLPSPSDLAGQHRKRAAGDRAAVIKWRKLGGIRWARRLRRRPAIWRRR